MRPVFLLPLASFAVANTASLLRRDVGSNITVPQSEEITTSHRSPVPHHDCSKACAGETVSLERKCYRYASDIPEWRMGNSSADGYLSFACLACINHKETLHAADHFEIGNSAEETQLLLDAIVEVSRLAGIPSQLPLAIALQESLASVRPHNGDSGRSRGMFQIQSSPPATTCYNTPIGQCSRERVHDMVLEGICGPARACSIPRAPGLAYYWRQSPGSIGLVARAYNSGSVLDTNDLVSINTGTSSYASDIVNRLQGRVTAAFMSRTCCATCSWDRRPLSVHTCTQPEAGQSDFCGNDSKSFQGKIARRGRFNPQPSILPVTKTIRHRAARFTVLPPKQPRGIERHSAYHPTIVTDHELEQDSINHKPQSHSTFEKRFASSVPLALSPRPRSRYYRPHTVKTPRSLVARPLPKSTILPPNERAYVIHDNRIVTSPAYNRTLHTYNGAGSYLTLMRAHLDKTLPKTSCSRHPTTLVLNNVTETRYADKLSAAGVCTNRTNTTVYESTWSVCTCPVGKEGDKCRVKCVEGNKELIMDTELQHCHKYCKSCQPGDVRKKCNVKRCRRCRKLVGHRGLP